jgi:hypothetical protein
MCKGVNTIKYKIKYNKKYNLLHYENVIIKYIKTFILHSFQNKDLDKEQIIQAIKEISKSLILIENK